MKEPVKKPRKKPEPRKVAKLSLRMRPDILRKWEWYSQVFEPGTDLNALIVKVVRSYIANEVDRWRDKLQGPPTLTDHLRQVNADRRAARIEKDRLDVAWGVYATYGVDTGEG